MSESKHGTLKKAEAVSQLKPSSGEKQALFQAIFKKSSLQPLRRPAATQGCFMIQGSCHVTTREPNDAQKVVHTAKARASNLRQALQKL